MISKLRLFDWSIIIIPMVLLSIGVVAIYTITFPTVQFDLARSQIIFGIIGLFVATVMTLANYRNWHSLAYLAYLLGIISLILVFFVGSKQFGAARWIDLGFFQLQPSELLKLFLILILARLLSGWSDNLSPLRILIILLVSGLPIILIFKQPDLGTASVLVAITVGLLAFARLSWRWWVGMLVACIIFLPVAYTQLQPYQQQRIRTFLAPEDDPTGQGYNVRQATIAIGSGGLLGQGLGKGSQSQLNFLPVAHTDFIFAGLAEATGLLGASILLGLYLVLLARIFRIAELARDQFGMYVALGVAIMLIFQIFVNVGMNLSIVPVTGIPLPFVSYGGTSLIISLASIGIVQSIYMRHRKITF